MPRKNKILEAKKRAIENHLGLNANDVKYPNPDNYDDEFEVSIDAKNWYLIEVVTRKIAIQNEKDINADFEIFENSIGCYTRLIETDFFFRWL